MPNTNAQTIHQMGSAINSVLRQATGRDAVGNIDMDFVTVAQNHRYEDIEVNGRVVSFIASEAGLPFEKILVYIVPVQEGSGTPSPDNVRPISGRTGIRICRTGKNLFPVGTATLTAPRGNVFDRLPLLLKAGTYTFTAQSTITRTEVSTLAFDSSSGARYSFALNADRNSVTFNLPADTVSFTMYLREPQTIYDIQLETGTSETEYAPYTGTEISIDWTSDAGTVYGGTVDIVTGELIVTWVNVDLGSLNWGIVSDAARHIFRAPYPTLTPYIGDAMQLPHAICSSYFPMAYSPISASDDGAFSLGGGSVIIIDHRFTDAALFKESVTGIKLVYEIETPIMYQLSPQEISTLLGQNYVWADSGDIEVKFKDIRGLY